MEIHRAQSFGPIAQTLGIKPASRVTYNLTRSGIVIWDLSTGDEYTITHGNPTPTVASVPVPSNVVQIINATDDDLKKRYSKSWLDGWSEERETMHTELVYRGINTLGL